MIGNVFVIIYNKNAIGNPFMAFMSSKYNGVVTWQHYKTLQMKQMSR